MVFSFFGGGGSQKEKTLKRISKKRERVDKASMVFFTPDLSHSQRDAIIKDGESAEIEAMEELWQLCSEDTEVGEILKRRKVSKKKFREIIEKIRQQGAGSKNGRDIPYCAMAYPETLNFVLEAHKDGRIGTKLALKLQDML